QYSSASCRRRSSCRSSFCSECSLFPRLVVCTASTSFSALISWRMIAEKSCFTYRDHTDPHINLQRRFCGKGVKWHNFLLKIFPFSSSAENIETGTSSEFLVDFDKAGFEWILD
ncbi:hypothetical protein DNTS_014651, partial [Danionella cerebrum]